jgi:hypothetical protein
VTRDPVFASAILDLRKIENYCLNPEHPRGRHKARVFRDSLAIERTDAAWLRDNLLTAVRQTEAVQLGADAFGTRWRVDAPITRHDRTAMIRTVWIVRTGENAPRFVTCWVL